jgi:hypothetical protein
MVRIFYCGGPSGRMGTLRAVIPLGDLAALLCDEIPIYTGSSFPEREIDSPSCTVIEIMSREEGGSWRAGFYLVEKGPLDFEDSLRTFRKAAGGSI